MADGMGLYCWKTPNSAPECPLSCANCALIYPQHRISGASGGGLFQIKLLKTVTVLQLRTHLTHLADRFICRDRNTSGYFACVRSELLEALRDKERRAQQQLDRCAEERGRKMEEQRRKEQKRRAAAEEKRRQQQEAEKVRGRPHANAAFTALAGASSWLPSFSFLDLN